MTHFDDPDESPELHDQIPTEPSKFKGATIVGAFNPDDFQQPFTFTLGPHTESKNWKPMTMPLSNFLAALGDHKVGKKDGSAFVLAELVPGKRLKTSVKSLTGVGLDIDTGMPSAKIDEAIEKFGCLAVRYTTHSHNKTTTEFKKDKAVKWCLEHKPGDDFQNPEVLRAFLKFQQWDNSIIESAVFEGEHHTEKGIIYRIVHKPMPKNRLVFILKEPFEIAKEGALQADAMKKWAKVPTALAAKMGLPLDTSCTDPSRLFYFPRHDEGKPFESKLFTGDFLDWRSLTLDDLGDKILAEVSKGKGKSSTAEGKALGRWSIKAATGFQIADVVEAYAPDRLRGSASQGFNIECPFDEDHSNAGDTDDRACFVVNAGMGVSEVFTISCQHEGCRNKTNLDMLAKMITDGWFDASVIEDEQYVATVLDEHGIAPVSYSDSIAALTPESSEAEVEKAMSALLAAKLGPVALDKALVSIAQKTQSKKTPVKQQFHKVRLATREREQAAKPAEYHGKVIIKHRGDFDFDVACELCADAIEKENENAALPRLTVSGQQPMRLRIDADGRALFEELDAVGMWSELTKLVCFVRQTDEGEGRKEKVPEDVSRHLFEQAPHYMRKTPKLIYTPCFLRDGTLLKTPGYSYEGDTSGDVNHLLLIPNGLDVPTIAKSPSRADAAASLKWLRTELLDDFPFFDLDEDGNETRDISEAHALAMIITPFMREMISGRTPVFFVNKPRGGTGGSLLASLPSVLFDGVVAAATRYSDNDEEMNKSLLTSAQYGGSHLFFDDVKRFLSGELLRNITSAFISGRRLGTNSKIEVPNHFNWVGSGNNTAMDDQMARRVIRVEMNARVSNMQTRKFRHPDVSGIEFEEFVNANRGVAIGHILNLIQYWIANGSVPFKDRKRVSFPDWCAKVGGVLQQCGVKGFLADKAVNCASPDKQSETDFVTIWLSKFNVGNPKTPKELFDLANDAVCEILSGTREDMKRENFYHRLRGLSGNTFAIATSASTTADYMVAAAKGTDERYELVLVAPVPLETGAAE